jgi:hypothetical protein
MCGNTPAALVMPLKLEFLPVSPRRGRIPID